MDVIYEIIRESPIGPFSRGYRSMVIFLFICIVVLLTGMLAALVLNASELTFHYGY